MSVIFRTFVSVIPRPSVARILNKLRKSRKKIPKDILKSFKDSPTGYAIIRSTADRSAERLTIVGELLTLRAQITAITLTHDIFYFLALRMALLTGEP